MAYLDVATLSQQYSNLLLPVIQQGNSRTAPSTMFKTGCKGEDIQVLDYIGKITNRQITDLMTPRDTVYDTVNGDSRWLPRPTLIESVLPISDESKLLRLVDMESGIRDEQIKALNRDMDIMFCKAAVGSAITSISNVAAAGSVPAHIASPYAMVALPADAVVELAATDTATEAVDKALEVFDSKDVDTIENPVYVYINSMFKSKLFEDTRYDNWNNMGSQVLADGELTPYRGVKFVRLSDADILNSTNSLNDIAIAVAGKAVCLGIWGNVETIISRNPAKDNIWQIHTKMSMAAVRLDEQRVVKIDTSAWVEE